MSIPEDTLATFGGMQSMATQAKDGLITLQEASSLLDVTQATLRNWDRKGKLKAVRHPVNNYRMYRLGEVLEIQAGSSLFAASDDEVQTVVQEQGPDALQASDLKRLISVLHRVLRDAEGNSSLIERFDELTKVLYCKAVSESTPEGNPFGSADGNAARIREFYATVVDQKPNLFPGRFAALALQDGTLDRIAEVLSPICITRSSSDLKGLAYEQIIRNTFEKGDNQQFFTPRPVVEFMVSMLDGHLKGVVCDPACGTGGFLIAVAAHLNGNGRSRRTHLLGLEVDARLAWATGINLDLHDAARFEVRHLDGAGSLASDPIPEAGRVDVVITNPPFGSDLSDTAALGTFELGRGRQSRRRGVLFIERCIELLRSGGLLAIIIDDGVLNAPSNADTRELILRQTDPFAIVSLPETAFMPYASVKASILFLQKQGGSQRRLARHDGTMFGRAEVVGRKPNGDPLLKLNPVTRRMELDSDLPELLRVWAGTQDEERSPCFWAQLPSPDDSKYKKDGLRLDLAFHDPSRHEAARLLAMSKFPMRSLAELCELRNEAAIPSQDFADEDISYISLSNIEPRTGVVAPSVVAGTSVKSTVKRVQAGDILFAKLRPELRKVARIGEEMGEAYASAECLILVPQKGDGFMLGELLAHILRSDLAFGQLVHRVIGIGRPRLSKSAVLAVRLPVPPLEDQHRLLQTFRRGQDAASALLEESLAARRKAEELRERTMEDLATDLLGIVQVEQHGEH